MRIACNARANHKVCLSVAVIFLTIAWPINTLHARNLGPFSYDGSIELEQRLFIEDSLVVDANGDDTAATAQTSIRLLAEFFTEWNDGKDRIVIEPFARLDSEDDERSHTDLRQALYTHYGDNFEFSAGIGKVFWGVAESLHLVDIINQTDLVENIDTEDKLGQAMLRYSYLSDVGTIEAFVLPGFRERTFPEGFARLSGGLKVDPNNAEFESDKGRSHVDLALRYSHSIGNWDIGLGWFSGTSREPDLLRLLNPTTGETTAFYPQIDQFSADIQLTTNGWLFKLEAIQREFDDDDSYDNFAAAITGAEYTIVGIAGSTYDLGLLAEYAWDQRSGLDTSVFQNDLFIGARLAFNDVSDSQLLFGYSNDLDNSDSRSVFLEASTRIGPALTLNIEARYFDSRTPTDPLFLFSNDSFIQIGIEYFFN